MIPECYIQSRIQNPVKRSFEIIFARRFIVLEKVLPLIFAERFTVDYFRKTL